MTDMPKTDTLKPTLVERFVREFKKFAIIFFYVWIIDGLFTLHKALILGLPPLTDQAFALLNAFVLGKIILLLEILKVGDVLPTQPPVFRIVLKAASFGLLLLAFSILEETVKGWFHGKGFEESIEEIGGGRLDGMLIVAVIMAVALMPYLICKEISRAMGDEKMFFLIFRRPAGVH